MTALKYALSGLAVAALTVFFVLFPAAYYRQADARSAAVTVQSITLEHAQQTLTPAQTMRLLYEQGANCIYTASNSQEAGDAVADDCRQIVRELFGSEEESYIATELCGRIDQYTADTVPTIQCMMLYEGEVVVLNLVSVWIDGDLWMCYEQDTLACVELSLYGPVFSDAVGMPNAYTDELEMKGSRIPDYYHDRGLKDGEFNYFAYNSDSGRQLAVGIFGLNTQDAHGLGLPLPRRVHELDSIAAL